MTYQTEAERLAAREAFVAQCNIVWPNGIPGWTADAFDRAYPQLAPVRMTPVRIGGTVDAEGNLIALGRLAFGRTLRNQTDRVVEVEVREVGSEQEGVPCKMIVNPEYPADKHFWYSRNHPDFPPHYTITPGHFIPDGPDDEG